jgi:uncharacterized membrane protein (DUF2068 family)
VVEGLQRPLQCRRMERGKRDCDADHRPPFLNGCHHRPGSRAHAQRLTNVASGRKCPKLRCGRMVKEQPLAADQQAVARVVAGDDAPSARHSLRPRSRTLAAIALFKLSKAVACVLLAGVAFHLLRPEVADQFGHWLESLTWATRHGVVASFVEWLAGLGPHQYRLFGSVAVVYAALYIVQGLGLWFGKRWAEYLVVIETGLLLPVEVWELFHKFSLFKSGIFAANVAIVVYLVYMLTRPSGSTPVSRG